MYDNLFGTTKYTSGNTYLVIKLLPLRLGLTFVPFVRKITGPFAPAVLPTQRTVIENLESLQFLSCWGLSFLPRRFIPPLLQRKKVSSKLN